MDNIIYCNCGSKVTKKKYKEHLKTKKHLNFTSKEDTNNDDVLEQTDNELSNIVENNEVSESEPDEVNKSEVDENSEEEEEVEEALPKEPIAKQRSIERIYGCYKTKSNNDY